MSSYKKETKNPRTGVWEMADWHDYGVVFDSDRERFGRDLPLRQLAINPKTTNLETR